MNLTTILQEPAGLVMLLQEAAAVVSNHDEAQGKCRLRLTTGERVDGWIDRADEELVTIRRNWSDDCDPFPLHLLTGAVLGFEYI